MPAFQHGQLLSESKILQHQTSAGVTDAKEGSKPEPKEVEHGARVTRIPMLFISKAGQNCGEAQRRSPGGAMVDLNGHEAGNGGHPKENLQPIGTPLLGETRFFTN